MFIRSLKISTPDDVIREMNFYLGLNLIIDKTPTSNGQMTGNNVGKTTVLKLVDFCLGAKPNIIYSDTEDKKSVYQEVKYYLIEKEVLITLVLADSFNDDANKIVIERNFLSRKSAIRRINGNEFLEKEFEDELLKILISHQKAEKPSFRQIIAHNIRYKDESINNTIKILNRYTSDVEYEALYLFLLGCVFDDGAKKQAILSKIKQEETYRERLEKKQTKTSYEVALSIIEDEIDELNEKKSKFNLNENFEKDLDDLNLVKYKINKTSSVISNMNIRRNLIIEAQNEMEQNIAVIDLKQLQLLYLETTKNIAGIQKTFEDLVSYHNNMLVEKARFIGTEFPSLEAKIKAESKIIKDLLFEEKRHCLHFLLNDKKDLIHDNQLSKVAEYVNDKNIQLVISILKDKLPEGLVDKANVVVELSQESKLFKIEETK